MLSIYRVTFDIVSQQIVSTTMEAESIDQAIMRAKSSLINGDYLGSIRSIEWVRAEGEGEAKQNYNYCDYRFGDGK